jgi:DAACS family dicarboxylate/amino acid:cation (Na+ or H+) symporter
MMKKLPLWNLMAIFIGVPAGYLIGPMPQEVMLLVWVPIGMVKALAAPLLFLAVFNGMTGEQFKGRGIFSMFLICILNMLAAIVIAISLVDFFEPGQSLRALVSAGGVDAGALNIKKMSWIDAVKGLMPDSVFGPFVSNNIPALIVLAVLAGLGVKSIEKTDHGHDALVKKVKSLSLFGTQVILHAMNYVLILMPVVIFVSVSNAIGTHGFSIVSGLLDYTKICIIGLLLQILVIYQLWLKLYCRQSLINFWRSARAPVIYAFGVNSSLATLPLTLSALKDLKCRDSAASLGACVGTNLNNDGILLYEVLALLILGQAAGLDWSLGHQIVLAGVCILATLGVSGFPEAGIIALTLVISSAGLNQELVALLLPLDWIIARLRSVTNVLGDMTVSLVVNEHSLQEDA